MTALEVVFNDAQNHGHHHQHDHDQDGARSCGSVHLLRQPETGPVRPARINLAGFCLYCLERACTDERCVALHEVSRWEICRDCGGSGYNPTTARFCGCESGLVDLTHSGWVNVPAKRPSRLTFAGYCIWCCEAWCDEQRCIELHANSRWFICPECKGVGTGEFDPCSCNFGLVEGYPTVATGPSSSMAEWLRQRQQTAL